MEEQQDLNTAIAYFEEQAELSPFAAQVAKWLTELKDARQKISILELAAKINADAWAQQSQFACDERQPKFTEIHTSPIISHSQTASRAWTVAAFGLAPTLYAIKQSREPTAAFVVVGTKYEAE